MTIPKGVLAVKVTSILMLRTSFQLKFIHSTFVADGAQQTFTLSPLTFKHMSYHGT